MISIGALEEAVLALLCFSPENSPKIAIALTSDLFSTRTNKKIAETALTYIEKYGQPPGSQLEYLLESDMTRGEEGKLLTRTVETLKKQSTEIQASFILEQLDNFLAIQKLSINVQDAAEALQSGDLDGAREALYRLDKGRRRESPGIWLTDPEGMYKRSDQLDEDFFTSSIQVMDDYDIRPERKTISFLIGPKGIGKTWWLTNVGKGGIQHHHDVLHITLEVSQEIMAQRYLQSIFALTKREAKEVQLTTFKEIEGGIDFVVKKVARESVITSKKKIQRLLPTLKSWGRLLIKEFPPGTLTLEQLHMYLDLLEKQDKFIPDEIIIDYPDLMYINPERLRIDTGAVYKNLRGLGVTRNAAVVAVSQGNRESETAKVVRGYHAAEDWSKLGTADNVYTISRTKEEKLIGLARIFAEKGRNAERDQFMVLIAQNYMIGQFCTDSVYMTEDISTGEEKATGGNK